jgi:hypothetical protein
MPYVPSLATYIAHSWQHAYPERPWKTDGESILNHRRKLDALASYYAIGIDGSHGVGDSSRPCAASGVSVSGWNAVVGCACQTASISGLDDETGGEALKSFIANMPPELRGRSFVHVTGKISSTPLDLPDRAEKFRKAISKDWLWFEYGGFDTTVHSLFGLPLPGDHPFSGVMSPRDGHTVTTDEAQTVVANILKGLDLNYSPLGAWLHEVNREVVVPTLESVPTPWDPFGWWGRLSFGGKVLTGAAALGLAALILRPYLPFIPR